MTKKQLTYFKNKLLEEKHRILQELDYERDEFKDLKRKEVGDLADAAFQLSEKNRQIEMSEKEKQIVKAIDAALIRLENGTYGKCVQTGKDIEYERLEAIPWVTTCIEAVKTR
ncbi:MAG: hypothetical protein A2096_16355 [Spirochaetes bacterium GWF1_41_5]|nr:MAG: hypothetical protein A2096_16355 [Spirochaetes bacterium GWF1_41_5]HBE03167.1 DNA-binding protein [Spirochaetia bacterium]